MSGMKILLVSQPARDGVLRHVSDLAEFLLSEGDEVHLAYSDWNATDQLSVLVDRIRSAGGGLINLGVRNAPRLGDVQAILRLRSFIEDLRPDIVHAHSSKAGALVRILGLFGLRVPILYAPHSYYRMHGPGDWSTAGFHALESLFGRVGTTMATSRCESAFAQQTLGIPLSRQVICCNAVDFDCYFPGTAATQNAIRSQLGLPPSVKLLGSVGRFSFQKDPLSMYLAFAQVHRELADVHLVHLGQGELEPAIDAVIAAEGIASRCHRLPYMSNTAPFYRALDGFLLTSLYEGMSFAAIEALATNLPMVLTRAPGNNDLAERGFSQIVWCDPGRVSSIAEGIRDWREMLDRQEPPNHRSISRNYFERKVCYQTIREVYRRQISPVSQNTDGIYA
jgi:glycosyltransferase involved in cell wall biosynthesis